MANLSNINNKFLVTTTGEVLIGGTAAIGAAKLQVTGEARVYTGSNLGYWGVDAGNSYVYLGTNSSGYGLSLQTAGTERMRIDSSGNVGIGTDSPSSFVSNGNKLVVGDGTVSQGITIYTSDNGNGTLYFADGTTGDEAYRGFVRYSHSLDSMLFYTAGANERMRIDSDGLVTLASMSSNDTRQLTFMGDSNSTSGNGGAIGMFADETRITSNWYYNSGQQKYVAGNGQAVIGLNTGATDASSFIGFGVNGPAAAAGPTLRMLIDSSGRVGIGVTPSYANAPLHTKNIGGGNSFNIFEGIGNAWVFGENDDTGTKYCQVAGRYGHHSGINVDLSGNVGIGTTSPNTGKLVVKGVPYVVTNSGQAIGGIDITSNASGANTYSGAISFGSTASGRAAIAGVQESSDADTQGLAFFTHGSGTGTADADERMRITRGGDVIIGGTVVENPASINRVLEIAAASPVGLILNDTRDPHPMTIANEGAVLNFKYNTTNMMTLPPSGDVQIPTNSASLQLRSSGSAAYTSIRRDGANQLIVANTAGNQVFGIGNGGELAITNGASYSGTETYSNAWNAGYQTLILGSQLSPNSVYMITINVGGGFGTPPYYASAVFTIVTAPSTNSTGGGFDNIAPTATHVNSNVYWKYRLSCISPGRNGVEAWLVNGPTSPPTNPTIYVKATKIMAM